jgi:putative protein-disulfide isomerase
MTPMTSSGPQLVFVGDPMCSWCYGFGHELAQALAQLPQAGLALVLGGLRAGGTERLDEAGKQFRLAHWARVEAATGLPFNRAAFLARQGFVYDTEPVCRAVVAARLAAPAANALGVFRALQRAFYGDGLDTTDAEVLVRVVAAELQAQGFAPPELRACFDSPQVHAATRADFAQARAWGVTSFPALLVRAGERVEVVVDGFSPAPVLVKEIRRWV